MYEVLWYYFVPCAVTVELVLDSAVMKCAKLVQCLEVSLEVQSYVNLVQSSSKLPVRSTNSPTVRTLCKDTPRASPPRKRAPVRIFQLRRIQYACDHERVRQRHPESVSSRLRRPHQHPSATTSTSISEPSRQHFCLSVRSLPCYLIAVRLILRVWAGWRLMPSLVKVGHLQQFPPTWHSLTLHFSRRGPDDQSCFQERFKEGDNQAQETATKA